jgi:hypothetical protein
MDQLERMVRVAHARLRLRRFLLRRDAVMADEKKPPLKIRMPIELAGLKGRMMRADTQEKAIAVLGERYDRVQDGIDELVGAHSEHAGALELYERQLRDKIESMVGSNGGDPLDGDGRDGQKSDGQVGQIISSKTEGA